MSGDSQERVLSRSRDCSGCRYISGVGLVGCGTYVSWCGLREVKRGRSLVIGIGIGFVYLGVARLLDIEPFGRSKKEEGSGP